MTAPTPAVTLDLQAAQSQHYRDRGIARYARDFTEAVVARHPDLVEQVLLNPRLPPVGGLDSLLAGANVTTRPSWNGSGGVFHALSPFELDIPLTELWPRAASRRGRRLVVTVYDLIPDIFPEIYLLDPGQRRRYRVRRELVRAADHIMTLSQSAAQDVVDRLGVPEGRISVVGAATGPAFRPAGDREQARAAAVEAVPGLEKHYVVYNGAAEPRKNVVGLLDAYARLPASLQEANQLVVVCRLTPPERHHFDVRAAQIGVADRVLFTGYVLDQDLALLYQAADLAVCPSIYEGYGYPVAEALACGAPVMASGTSSLVELVAPGATFDPRRPESIAEALVAGLTDTSMRERLLRWADRPRPTWADVADRAAAVYERLGDGPVRRWRRPLVALVTPWPPAATGVAVYNQQLVDALGSRADVDVFVDGDPATASALDRLPSRDRAVGGYDAVILAVGNSEFHAGALRLLRQLERPVYVHAHDVRLVNLYLHGAARDAVPEGFEAALAAQHPELPPDAMVDGRLPDSTADERGVLMLREVAQLADRLLVTSDFAARLAALGLPPEDAAKLAVWPYAYPRTVDRPEDGVDPGLVCSFGVVNSVKDPILLVEAFALLAADRPGRRLLFAGPVSDADRMVIERRAAELDLSGAVAVTGRLDDGDYEDLLRRAGLAVQLRRWSNGETSGAVADCLSHGVPTIVTAIGPQADLGPFVVKLTPGAPAADLAALMAAVLDDPSRRRAMSEEGRAFARRHGFDWAAATLFDVLPELAVPSGGRR